MKALVRSVSQEAEAFRVAVDVVPVDLLIRCLSPVRVLAARAAAFSRAVAADGSAVGHRYGLACASLASPGVFQVQAEIRFLSAETALSESFPATRPSGRLKS